MEQVRQMLNAMSRKELGFACQMSLAKEQLQLLGAANEKVETFLAPIRAEQKANEQAEWQRQMRLAFQNHQRRNFHTNKQGRR